MERSLGPLPSWAKRYTLCAVLLIPALISSAPWGAKLFSVCFVIAMAGTTRTSKIVGPELIGQIFVGFIPLKPERVKLKFVVEVETGLRREMNMFDWALFGAMVWITERGLKWIWPWLSGDFELWVITAREKRFLAWRGNGDALFQENLTMLKSATGAKVRRV